MASSIQWSATRWFIALTAIVLIIILESTPFKAEVRTVALDGVSASETYLAQLEAALRAKGHKITITNEGVDGDTTRGVLARLDRVVPSSTNIVVLNIGDPRGTPSCCIISAGAQSIMAKLRAKGIAVYRITRMQQDLVDRASCGEGAR